MNAMSPRAVRLLGLSTALPPHVLPQDVAVEAARSLLGPRIAHFDQLASAFVNAGISTRHTVVPLDWFFSPHGWTDRSAAFVAGATELFRTAATAALDQAGLRADQVDVIVTVSSTGVATPTLEALEARRMGFRADSMRVPVFGLGCAGGVSGLAIARELAAARPGAVVLMVAVEACSLMFRLDRLTKADIIAAALFADGAAACVLRASPEGDPALPVIGRGRQHMWPDTLGIMGWRVEETGLGVIFDRSIPTFAHAELRPAFDALWPPDEDRPPIARFACHPGGAKVITALEDAFDLTAGTLAAERQVLERCGNMSAPTVLFVLRDVLHSGQAGRVMTTALGPGFTLSTLAVDVGS